MQRVYAVLLEFLVAQTLTVSNHSCLKDVGERQSNARCMTSESDCISKLHKYFLKIMRFRGENHFLLTSQCLPVYLKILILLFQDISTRCQFEITQKKKKF